MVSCHMGIVAKLASFQWQLIRSYCHPVTGLGNRLFAGRSPGKLELGLKDGGSNEIIDRQM